MDDRKEFVKHGLVRLPPGFRFQPTDEELVVQYLRRKAMSFPLPAAIIPEIELGKLNPWDLPSGFGGDKYFFYLREGKKRERVYNQEKVLGYWKAMGKKKPVMSASRGNELVGTKQVMVFHRGKPPYRSKTDWIMYEYSLCNNNNNELLMSSTQGLAESGKEWVVCRIFAKRRSSMNLNARSRKHEEKRLAPATCSSSSSSSCVTEDACDEVSVNGDEAMSKKIIA